MTNLRYYFNFKTAESPHKIWEMKEYKTIIDHAIQNWFKNFKRGRLVFWNKAKKWTILVKNKMKYIQKLLEELGLTDVICRVFH